MHVFYQNAFALVGAGVVPLSELLLLLFMAGCATTFAIWSGWDLWRPPHHTIPAVSAGMAGAVLGRLVLELIFSANSLAAEVIWTFVPELVWMVTPVAGAVLGVLAWRSVEVWHEQDMTVAGLLGFDDEDMPDNKSSKPVRTGGGHYGLKAQLPPSSFGAKRKQRP